MKPSFDDIKSLTGIEPFWYDENGVPRYCDQHPKNSSNIFCDRAAFVRISCQSCGKKFIVCISQGVIERVANGQVELPFEIGMLDYGDPPFHRCNGDTMSSESVEIVSAWERDHKDYTWKKVRINIRQTFIDHWKPPQEKK